MRFDFNGLSILGPIDLATIGAFLLIGWPAFAAPPSIAERFPLAKDLESVETSTMPDGSRSIEVLRTTCRRDADVETCVTTEVSGKGQSSISRERLDERGVWSLGSEFGDGGRMSFSPAPLLLPADVAPGSRWQTTFEQTITMPGSPPLTQHARRDFLVTASTKCPTMASEPGFLVTAVKIVDGKKRSESESLYCPGLPAPWHVVVRMYRDGALTKTIESVSKPR